MKIKASKSISFLMEFVIILCFFCVTSLICVSIYGNSVRMNRNANHGKKALVYAQNYIENKEKREVSTFYLNEGFKETLKDKKYTVKITAEEDGKHKISIFEKKVKLISLSFYESEADSNE